MHMIWVTATGADNGSRPQNKRLFLNSGIVTEIERLLDYTDGKG